MRKKIVCKPIVVVPSNMKKILKMTCNFFPNIFKAFDLNKNVFIRAASKNLSRFQLFLNNHSDKISKF